MFLRTKNKCLQTGRNCLSQNGEFCARLARKAFEMQFLETLTSRTWQMNRTDIARGVHQKQQEREYESKIRTPFPVS